MRTGSSKASKGDDAALEDRRCVEGVWCEVDQCCQTLPLTMCAQRFASLTFAPAASPARGPPSYLHKSREWQRRPTVCRAQAETVNDCWAEGKGGAVKSAATSMIACLDSHFGAPVFDDLSQLAAAAPAAAGKASDKDQRAWAGASNTAAGAEGSILQHNRDLYDNGHWEVRARRANYASVSLRPAWLSCRHTA